MADGLTDQVAGDQIIPGIRDDLGDEGVFAQGKPEEAEDRQGRDQPQVPEAEELDAALLVAVAHSADPARAPGQQLEAEIDHAPGNPHQNAEEAISSMTEKSEL